MLAGLTLTFVISGVSSGTLPVTKIALADSSRVVSLFYDGQKKVFTTDQSTVKDVLQRADVTLASDDLVEPKTDTVIPPGLFNINVFRARPVIIIDGSSVVRTRSPFENPKLIATTAGLQVYPEDEYESAVVTDFVDDRTIGQRLVIKRATPVSLVADGKVTLMRTQAKTIGAFLADKNVALGEKDTVSPARNLPLTQNLRINITRVSEVVVAKDEVIPKSTKTETDPNVAKGTSTVKIEGTDGHRHVTYRIHYNDGVEIARETLKVEGQVEPVAKVLVVGTKVFFAGSVEYWRPFVVDAAAANGVDPNLMLAIMKCESNGNANASNGSHFGLYQYAMATWTGSGGTPSNIYDGPTQITITAKKIASYGTSPWLASKSCWSGSY